MNLLRRALLIALVTVFFAGTSHAGKIDPMLGIMAARPNAALTMKSFGAKSIGGVAMAEVIIKAKQNKTDTAKAFIEGLGGSVKIVLKTIITATIPLSALPALESSDLIVAVEAAKPITPKMNAARENSGGSNAIAVQDGTCNGCDGTSYTGEGVIVGIVDSGIDCRHADFMDEEGNTRILFYQDQSTGTEYSGDDLGPNGACLNSPDDDGHGTHVAGIAAGSNSYYTGVAPSANIIAVQYAITDAEDSFSTQVLDGVDYIFEKASALNMPAVINLSLGTSLGAHDGTSLFEQGLDESLGAGRAIVNAAGNENVSPIYPASIGGIHAPINTSGGTAVGYEVVVIDSAPVVAQDGAIIDFWLDAGAQCDVKVEGYSRLGAKLISMDWVEFEADPKSATDNSALIEVNFDETASSGKLHGSATINAADGAGDDVLKNYYFVFMLNGTCTGNAWLYPDYTALLDFTQLPLLPSSADYTYTAGDSNMTITIPGTAEGVITVASYMDRDTWVDIDGVTQNQTDGDCGSTGTLDLDISTFSSLGPTASASSPKKPDITAPGEPIVSTLSSACTDFERCQVGQESQATEYYHYKLEGTSMASPHVAGVVALMMQKDKCMTCAEAKQYIKATAAKDSKTGDSPDPYVWGAGKLDATEIMAEFEERTTCPSSSKCSFVRDSTRSAIGSLDLIIFVLVGISALVALRRKYASGTNG